MRKWEHTKKSDTEVWKGLFTYYYNNRDLRFLLDLLAETSGIAASLRVLTSFDKDLYNKFKPKDIEIAILNRHKGSTQRIVIHNENNIVEQDKKEEFYDVTVEFPEAEAVNEIVPLFNNVKYMYIIEIKPSTPSSSVVSIDPDTVNIEEKQISGIDVRDKYRGKNSEAMMLEDASVWCPLKQPTMYEESLAGLKLNTDYSICISTIVDGRTIAKKTKRIIIV